MMRQPRNKTVPAMTGVAQVMMMVKLRVCFQRGVVLILPWLIGKFLMMTASKAPAQAMRMM